MGANSGYQHYQCRYETSNGDYETERRYWGDIQLELQEAGGWSKYECKDGNFYSYLDDELGKYRFRKLKAIQLCILAKTRRQSDRKLTIVVDKLGGVIGKTFLARWCDLNGKGIYIDGTDTRNLIRNLYDAITDNRGLKKYQIFVDLCRADKLTSELFGRLESAKNGYFADGRYHFVYEWVFPPQICIFTNKEPDWEKLTNDRWDKMFIKEKEGKIILWDRDKKGNARTRTFNRNN